MPRGDGTGPAGMGPMTGRGAGICAGYAMPGFANRGIGFGSGYRRGGGCGFGNGFRGRMAQGRQMVASWSATSGYAGAPDEQTLLKNQAEALKSRLAMVQKRIDELGKAD